MLDSELYRKTSRDYLARLAVMDEQLYRLCREHPYHDDVADVHAKVARIGRTYAAGVERRIRSEGEQNSALNQLVAFINKRHWKVDDILGELEDVKEPLQGDDIRLIVSQHGRLVSLLSQLIETAKVTSFAAKYMHFHNAAVPMFDQIANRALRRLYPWRKLAHALKRPYPRDAKYWRYAARFWQLYQELDARPPETVRLLDRYLVAWAERIPRGRGTTKA